MSSNCLSDDDDGLDPNNNSVVIAEVSATVQTGTWRISNFVDSGTNETNDFTGYNCTFNTNGILVADNGSTTINGNWSLTNDDSSDDSSDDDSNSSDFIDFNIAFSTPSDFAELTEDWHIVSRISTQIVLIHISGGNGGTDNLTFGLN